MATYIIFGASGGVGSALCRKLAKEGHKVFGSSRFEERFSLIREAGAEPLRVDVFDPDTFKAAIAEANSQGNLAGVACCIGSILLKPAHLTKDEDWKNVLSLNLDSAFYTLRSSIPTLIQNGGGAIVFVSSVAARFGLPNHEAIAAAKAGVEGLVRSAAATYASKKIRVNAVAPSLTLTPLAEKFSDPVREASRKMHPLQQLGEADDVASALEFFLSPNQKWVTGQILGLDGGLSELRAQI